jgi:glyoxylase-like metal-dependent hydrolase (beta-lactamase superfamily II)
MTDLPVAPNWFEIKEVGEGIFKVCEPHVVSFMRGNIFVVKTASQCLLIDGGNGVMPLRPFLKSYALEPTIVVASHAHADHIGALHEWPLTLVHKSEAEGLATLAADTTLAEADYDITDISTLKTGDPSLTGSMITALPYAGFTSKDYRLVAPRVEAIEDGHVIDLGERSFEVLHLPGHCPGQIGFWDAQNKVLIGGDAIYDGEPLDTLHHSNRAENRRSLQRLQTLDPVITHGGHEDAMTLDRMREIIHNYLAATG